MTTITQAIISAGGFGTRLKPITDTIPKPMIPILGKPMLEWHIAQFKLHGVTEIFLTLHHLPEVVMDHFGDGSKWNVKMNYGVEVVPLGSGGGIKQFESRLDKNFYYIYGDTFSLIDYSKMLQVYGGKRDPIGMQRVKLTSDYSDADVAELDASGRFIAIHKKPHTEKISNAYRLRGAFILEKEILNYIPADTPCDIGKDLLPRVVEEDKNFYGYECSDYSKGIDTMEKWKEVENYLKKENIGPWW